MTPRTAASPSIPDHDALTRHVALIFLNDRSAALANFHREIANLRAKELAARSTVWQQSQERSASGRDDEAKYAAAHITYELLSLQGERDALIAEIDYFRQFLHHTTD